MLAIATIIIGARKPMVFILFKPRPVTPSASRMRYKASENFWRASPAIVKNRQGVKVP